MKDQYFTDYFERIKDSLDTVNVDELTKVSNYIRQASNNNRKIITVGNGGSASIANHVTIDLINAAGIRALSFSDPGVITCFANDYGYENWVVKALESYAEPGDLVVLISSSGKSENILKAAKFAKDMGTDVVTFSGFSEENPLRKLGDINFWVDSSEYNNIEMVHHIWLLAIIDLAIENNKGEEL